jgi:hypothetical protein
LPHYENSVLIVLKKFCQAALEVDLLDEGTKEMISLRLLDAAFITDTQNHKRDYENPSDEFSEMNNAFDIIELLDVRCDQVINTS